MAYHFIKLTDRYGNPVYINGDHVAAVHEDAMLGRNGETVVVMNNSGVKPYYSVVESMETVTDLLYGMMNN